MATKKPKDSNRHRRAPLPSSPDYDAWRKRISRGMRAAKKKRREAGLRSIAETALLYDLPLTFVRRKVRLGELRVLRSGNRAYIAEADAEAVFGRRRRIA